MPTLWRYVLGGYLRIFLLSISTFIATLLVLRFKEIARFTALSGNWEQTAIFVLYQIPLILPLAIPISALIASLLLLQRLSRTFELTTLCASGLSIVSILAPILFASLLLSLLNLGISGELAPFCRRASKILLYQETSSNPLLLLQRQRLIKIKHGYLKMEVEEEGKIANDLVLIVHNENNQSLSLFSARQLTLESSALLGTDVAILSHLRAEEKESFDPLIIENQSSMSTEAPVLSAALKKKRPRLEANALNLRMLRLRSRETGKQANGALIEILQRLSLSLAPFSFTLLGCTFGINQGRSPSKKNLIAGLGAALVVLASYFLGKDFKAHPLMASLSFFCPHLFVWILSSLKLRRIARGHP